MENQRRQYTSPAIKTKGWLAVHAVKKSPQEIALTNCPLIQEVHSPEIIQTTINRDEINEILLSATFRYSY